MNMREIKFRFCIIENKKIADWNTTLQICDRLSLFKKEAFIPMQYTGLKDKNNKEIYEGDIIENTHVRFEIFWDNSLCAFRCKRKNSPDVYLHELPIIKKYWIIGNIYENPELLKDE